MLSPSPHTPSPPHRMMEEVEGGGPALPLYSPGWEEVLLHTSFSLSPPCLYLTSPYLPASPHYYSYLSLVEAVAPHSPLPPFSPACCLPLLCLSACLTLCCLSPHCTHLFVGTALWVLTSFLFTLASLTSSPLTPYHRTLLHSSTHATSPASFSLPLPLTHRCLLTPAAPLTPPHLSHSHATHLPLHLPAARLSATHSMPVGHSPQPLAPPAGCCLPLCCLLHWEVLCCLSLCLSLPLWTLRFSSPHCSCLSATFSLPARI